MRSRCQSRAWASLFIIPRCATPSRETWVAGDNFTAGGGNLCDDTAKLCPTRVQHHAQDAVDAEPGCQRRASVVTASVRACRRTRGFLCGLGGGGGRREG